MKTIPTKYFLKDDGVFPNNILPVVLYRKALTIPMSEFLLYMYLKLIFYENGWTRNWRGGIFNFNHYHSNAHEVLGVCSGKTSLLLGGEDGTEINIEKGDVLVIPAGVAHKNLGRENNVSCIGGYFEGITYDMNYGNQNERPGTDLNIASLPIPDTDPLYGRNDGIVTLWQKSLFHALTRI